MTDQERSDVASEDPAPLPAEEAGGAVREPAPDERAAPPPARPSAALALTGVVLGMIGVAGVTPVGIAGLVVGVVALWLIHARPQRHAGTLQAGVAILFGVYCGFRQLGDVSRVAEIRECALHMKHIGDAFHLYLSETDGGALQTLDDLMATGRCPAGNFVCPADAHGTPNYMLAPPPPPAFPGGIHAYPLLFEPKSNHKTGANVLFLDGHVQFIEGDAYEALMRTLQQAHQQASPPPAVAPGAYSPPSPPAPSESGSPTAAPPLEPPGAADEGG